jgi:hypothetical protein
LRLTMPSKTRMPSMSCARSTISMAMGWILPRSDPVTSRGFSPGSRARRAEIDGCHPVRAYRTTRFPTRLSISWHGAQWRSGTLGSWILAMRESAFDNPNCSGLAAAPTPARPVDVHKSHLRPKPGDTDPTGLVPPKVGLGGLDFSVLGWPFLTESHLSSLVVH